MKENFPQWKEQPAVGTQQGNPTSYPQVFEHLQTKVMRNPRLLVIYVSSPQMLLFGALLLLSKK